MSEIALPAPAMPGAQPNSGHGSGYRTTAAIALAGFVSAVIGWLSFPYTTALLRAQLEDKGIAGATIERVIERSTAWRSAAFVTSPIAEAAKVAAVACLIVAICWVAETVISYRHALWIAACAELIATLKRGIVLIIIGFRGVDVIQHPADLAPPVGLDLIVPGGPLLVRALVSFVNPFDGGTLVLIYWMSRRFATKGTSAYLTATCGAVFLAFRVLVMKLTG